jgi:exopolyphosphatase / guanosine-5'-triphosphate,3'-diphosphate pyrophosphatase
LKIAAVDIGSNAARLQISSVLHDEGEVIFKKVEYVRFPLRLGVDVFNYGRITPEGVVRIKKLMHCYKLLMELHGVSAYMICATSAMREAENAQDIINLVKADLDMEIHVIDGKTEAELINDVVVNSLDRDKNYLHIDVGGGSTELNVYKNRSKVASRSFKIGSVRLLQDQVPTDVWKKMQKWIEEYIDEDDNITAVGTGGNISKLFNMIENRFENTASLESIEAMQKYIAGFSLEDRIHKLRLNPDRADVVVPASQIYLSAMRWAGAKRILVPDLGLKDGILKLVYENLDEG